MLMRRAVADNVYADGNDGRRTAETKRSEGGRERESEDNKIKGINRITYETKYFNHMQSQLSADCLDCPTDQQKKKKKATVLHQLKPLSWLTAA